MFGIGVFSHHFQHWFTFIWSISFVPPLFLVIFLLIHNKCCSICIITNRCVCFWVNHVLWLFAIIFGFSNVANTSIAITAIIDSLTQGDLQIIQHFFYQIYPYNTQRFLNVTLPALAFVLSSWDSPFHITIKKTKQNQSHSKIQNKNRISTHTCFLQQHLQQNLAFTILVTNLIFQVPFCLDFLVFASFWRRISKLKSPIIQKRINHVAQKKQKFLHTRSLFFFFSCLFSFFFCCIFSNSTPIINNQQQSHC